MSGKIILMIIFTLLLACNGKKSNKEYVPNVNQVGQTKDDLLLRGILENFLSNEQVKSDVITVECRRRNDTLSFFIVDAYPTPDQMIGYTSIKNHKVCMVGDAVPSGFLNIEFKDVPVEVRKRDEELRDLKDIRQIKNVHPYKETVCFKGKSLIQCPQLPVH